MTCYVTQGTNFGVPGKKSLRVTHRSTSSNYVMFCSWWGLSSVRQKANQDAECAFWF